MRSLAVVIFFVLGTLNSYAKENICAVTHKKGVKTEIYHGKQTIYLLNTRRVIITELLVKLTWDLRTQKLTEEVIRLKEMPSMMDKMSGLPLSYTHVATKGASLTDGDEVFISSTKEKIFQGKIINHGSNFPWTSWNYQINFAKLGAKLYGVGKRDEERGVIELDQKVTMMKFISSTIKSTLYLIDEDTCLAIDQY